MAPRREMISIQLESTVTCCHDRIHGEENILDIGNVCVPIATIALTHDFHPGFEHLGRDFKRVFWRIIIRPNNYAGGII